MKVKEGDRGRTNAPRHHVLEFWNLSDGTPPALIDKASSPVDRKGRFATGNYPLNPILPRASSSPCIPLAQTNMADDTTEPQPTSAPTVDSAVGSTSAGAEPPKKYPKGVILGKDGKP